MDPGAINLVYKKKKKKDLQLPNNTFFFPLSL